MLTPAQQARIVHHLKNGWKLPDSLVQELWSAYQALEESQRRPQAEGDDRHENVGVHGKGRAGSPSREAYR